jgi:hypothetical protein
VSNLLRCRHRRAYPEIIQQDFILDRDDRVRSSHPSPRYAGHPARLAAAYAFLPLPLPEPVHLRLRPSPRRRTPQACRAILVEAKAKEGAFSIDHETGARSAVPHRYSS